MHKHECFAEVLCTVLPCNKVVTNLLHDKTTLYPPYYKVMMMIQASKNLASRLCSAMIKQTCINLATRLCFILCNKAVTSACFMMKQVCIDLATRFIMIHNFVTWMLQACFIIIPYDLVARLIQPYVLPFCYKAK